MNGIMPEDLSCLGDLLHWSYANLAMAHAAVAGGAVTFGRTHFIIRARLFKGLQTGTMKVGSLVLDEKAKLHARRACVYCGVTENLSADHIIPPSKGGRDSGENLVLACRSCNSSKRDHDLLKWWHRTRGTFPPLLLLRRYLKLAMEYAAEQDLLGSPLDTFPAGPFRFDLIPRTFPAPAEMTLE